MGFEHKELMLRKTLFVLLGSMALHSITAKEVMLMNRVGPSKSELWIANADGTHAHKLLRASVTMPRFRGTAHRNAR